MAAVARKNPHPRRGVPPIPLASPTWKPGSPAGPVVNRVAEQTALIEAAFAVDDVKRYPPIARFAILVGSSALLWGGIFWAATSLAHK
jgi:hypothetical protein